MARPAALSAPASALAQVLLVGALAALPVAWVLGAMPRRRPTLLIEWMFTGFSRCALDHGALNPLRMVCDRAGVPLGMDQLDGGLSYPLGGVFVRLGVAPLTAWRLAVGLLLVVGFVALAWLGYRMTASRAVAGFLAVLFGLNGTLTARTWNWYWNTVAAALLPVLLAAVYVLFVRARRRELRALLAPGTAVLAATLLIGIEWQYAVVFAMTAALGALAVLAVQRGWTGRERAIVVTVGLIGLAAVVTIMRWRLSLAGIDTQFSDSYATAADEGADLVSFVAPGLHASFTGRILGLLGRYGMLAEGLTEGRQLWVAPYLGVGLLTFLAVLIVRRRPALPANDRCPRGFMALLIALTGGAVVLSMGPQWHVARMALPGATVASPLAWLWTSTPLRWVRYPWTFDDLTTLTLLLALAAMTPALLRRDGRWSPLVWVLAGLAVLELGSPQVAASILDPLPSVAAAPSRLTTADPVIERFDADAIPELHRALADAGGVTVILPWGNTWFTPHLGPEAGVPVRNVGIDRNVSQVEAAAPVSRPELRTGSGTTIDRLFTTGWADTVVLLDFNPTAEAIVRHGTHRLIVADVDELDANARAVRVARRLGYCVDRGSWFTVVTACDQPGDAPEDRAEPPAVTRQGQR